MSIGPLSSFVFPGVLTQTLNEAPQASAQGATRFPAFIGVGDEILPVTAYEMVRGSSSIADNPITKELIVSSIAYPIDGLNRTFRVTYYPIVSGKGGGVVTTDITTVIAYVNGKSVPIASLDGQDGLVNLINAPLPGDMLEISYYYKVTDTLIQNENLSLQADGTNVTFKVENLPIVSGNNGGVTTTDPTKVTANITDGSKIFSVTAVNGGSGLITLSAAPSSTATVYFSYYTNTTQNTADILPSHNVASITKVGYNSTSTDFVNGKDYVLDTTGQFDTINWGNSFKVAQGVYTAGNALFSAKITGSLYDNICMRRQADGTVNGINKTFTIEAIPTNGTSQSKITDNPGLISVYIGMDPSDATLAGQSGQPGVAEMSGINQTITFASAPAAGQNVYVTEYENLLTDDTWTFVDTTTGAGGAGYVSITGASSGIAYTVDQSTGGGTSVGTAHWRYPADSLVSTSGVTSDAMVNPGSVAETVTLTFLDATGYRYSVTSTNAAGTGSLGDNTGYVNQTYIDLKTGFRVTICQTSNEMTTTGTAFHAGNFIKYNVTVNAVTGASTLAIPGMKVTVSDTLQLTANTDTALLTTYNNNAGNEPAIGDYYYVSYMDNKDFDLEGGFIDPVFVTTEKDALAYTGSLSVSNKLALAAHLAFLNGAPGMILLQVQKSSGGTEAPVSAYTAAIDYFNNPMQGGLRPALMEPVTTLPSVLSYLKTSNTIQSSIRYANERMSYFGFPINTSPSQAVAFAQSMNSELMTGIYPDGGTVTLTDELGNSIDYLVDGSLFAAAIAGVDTKPAYDVAEPLTRKQLVGFTQLYRRMDTVTQAQAANAGLTILEEQPAGMIVKIDLTTDVTSALTRTPSVIRIKQFVQQGTRNALNPYIGMKFLPSRLNEIETTLKSYLSALVKAGIIVAFQGVKATPDANDPTTVNVEAYYAPTLPLLWIVVTFNLRTSLS
jgi:hypothetical protein